MILVKKTLLRWFEGKSLFWSHEAEEGEHLWKLISCSQCCMKSIIGTRHVCINKKCSLNLCPICAKNFKHEHPLVEYLIPKKHYSLEELCQSIPHLLDPNSEETLETKTLWQDGVKAVGFYFSAHWCPPCRHFTPKLGEVYKQAQEESFNEYRKTMPWPAVPLNSGSLLKAYFQCSGMLVLLFDLKTILFLYF